MNSTADPLHVPEGPITRSKIKKIQEAYTLHLQKLASVQVETKTFEPKNLYLGSMNSMWRLSLLHPYNIRMGL